MACNHSEVDTSRQPPNSEARPVATNNHPPCNTAWERHGRLHPIPERRSNFTNQGGKYARLTTDMPAIEPKDASRLRRTNIPPAAWVNAEDTSTNRSRRSRAPASSTNYQHERGVRTQNATRAAFNEGREQGCTIHLQLDLPRTHERQTGNSGSRLLD